MIDFTLNYDPGINSFSLKLLKSILAQYQEKKLRHKAYNLQLPCGKIIIILHSLQMKEFKWLD